MLIASAVLGACECAPASHAPGDAASEQPPALEAGEPGDAHEPDDAHAAVDGPVDAPDTGVDDGGAGGPFGGGWERIPFLPEWCDGWQPKGEATDVIDGLEFETCDPPSPGCEALVVDWSPSPTYDSYLGAGKKYQTWGTHGLIMFKRAAPTGDGPEYVDEAMYALDGTPLAVWRMRLPKRPRTIWCDALALSVSDDRAALAFLASTGRYEETGDDDAYSLKILEGPATGIQHRHEVLYDLNVDDILSVGNTPSKLHYDGESVIVQGPLGGVYLGSWRGGPWGEIASASTDDYQNANGWLHDGSFYWSSTNGYGYRIRRRQPDATENETSYRNRLDWLGAFRIDDEWAVWINSLDRSPTDTEPERTQIRAARVADSANPSDWDVRVFGEYEYPTSISLSDPLFWNGRYAYKVNDKTVEVLDLDREQRLVLELATERELWWGTALYLGPRYLMLTLRGTRGVVGLRRYDLGEVEGWTPVDVEPAEGGS